MWQDLSILPEGASTISGQIDLLWWFLVALTVFFTVLVAGVAAIFVARYRRRPGGPPAVQFEGSMKLEIVWTAIPLLIVLGIFVWGAILAVRNSQAPADAADYYVVGKQWMWKIQHPTGQREINALHVPVNQPIRLTMTSEDVLHSFFVPAFRWKRDVLPGRYTEMWFEATKTGQYHIFCAEYCGTKHSQMIGTLYVMERDDYERWLSGVTGDPPEVAGANLFESMRCSTCHPIAPGATLLAGVPARGPTLAGIYGKQVELKGGAKVTVDDAYIRESIFRPLAKVVATYEPVMPTYEGQLNEEQILQLAAYIKSLKEAQ